ncbi:phosphatidylethanolamine-binding protein [Chaetomium fimeti]|uniref:Phosphatidylethanolamine-binding protein n=1 Tax=Chaetomium fimeti TaxID=1854472 RepID=A0AAE0LQV5_9PEZI|nr:phosphatidylethanolamine-binding protein [Chaetomium fimeti]
MATALLSSLQQANLLPSKAIPADFTPTFDLTVRFPGESQTAISNGTLVRVSQVSQAPTISISANTAASPSAASPDAPKPTRLTLLLIDPDAPTPDDPKFAYWRHWVVTGIPAPSTEVAAAASEGRTLTAYLAPGPKDESGPHRYLFLLFAEPEGLELRAGDVGGEAFVERRSFGVEEFVGRHGLRLVGVQWMRGVGDGWVGEE